MSNTIEITVRKFNSYDNFIGDTTSIEKVIPITEWRKGFVICKNKKKYDYYPDYYYLVNSNFEAIVIKQHDEELPTLPIQRAFGGFYVIYELVRYDYITFPGKDRETEYKVGAKIKQIVLENGEILNESYFDFFGENTQEFTLEDFLQQHPQIEFYQELGENIILKGSSLYHLSDYSYIADIPKGTTITDKFINGICKINIEYAYKDFVVLVRHKKIAKVYDKLIFNEICQIINPNFFNKTEEKIIKEKTEVQEYTEHKPYIISIIDGYLYGFPNEYNCCVTNFHTKKWLRDALIYQGCNFTGFFCKNGVWYHIDTKALSNEADKLVENYYPVKNFIEDIKSYNKEVVIDGEKYTIYEFKCRPFGTLNKNGQIQYTFNVDNIDW